MSRPDPKELLVEGVSDALGFLLGGLAGWAVGQWLGFDFFAEPGYNARAMTGLVLIALGCGAGKWAALRWRRGRKTKV
ncbi:hypothetical protein [Ideonella sp. BN130291]|uniref:hypothetical protein n=1 Tax=Ideonella sp. BN130291 TaxID=3112940 RepID=UPI002E26454B|nr:hypothetical protein [Ideonella sp. BN130291]